MAGETRFADKQFDDAVRVFFKVAYGYGDQAAPIAFHHWQAEAMFEAGRCLDASGRPEAGQKLYRELLQRFPDSQKAAHARKLVSRVATTKSQDGS